MEDRNENMQYGMNEPYQNNTPYEQQPYGQNVPYGQNASYGQNQPYTQNTAYGQNQPYGQNAPYEQNAPQGQNIPYGQQYVQQPYGQPQYTHPIVVRDTMADRNGSGIAGFVIACFAILFCWVPGADFVLSIIGIVCSAIGLGKDKQSGRGLAVAGLIISVIALLLSLFMCFLMFVIS